MFIEPNLSGARKGWIEVVCGSMFSGKTEELIRRLKRARIANLKVEIFKPAIDTRYDQAKVVSHDASSIPSTPIDNSQTILLMAQDVDVVGIDEAQFFDAEIIHVCETLALRGVRVIVAGLDMDYMDMSGSQNIKRYKLHAICMKCGSIANISYRKTADAGQVLLGEKDTYEPRCRTCFHES